MLSGPRGLLPQPPSLLPFSLPPRCTLRPRRARGWRWPQRSPAGSGDFSFHLPSSLQQSPTVTAKKNTNYYCSWLLIEASQKAQAVQTEQSRKQLSSETLVLLTGQLEPKWQRTHSLSPSLLLLLSLFLPLSLPPSLPPLPSPPLPPLPSPPLPSSPPPPSSSLLIRREPEPLPGMELVCWLAL